MSSGGTEIVSSGGSTSVAIVSSGGTETVLSSGSSLSTTVRNGGLAVVSGGGVTTSSYLSSGGTERVLSGGVDQNTVISSGGLEFISSAGTVSGGTLISGGTIDVLAGGAVQAGLTISGASDAVISGTVASGQSIIFAGSGGKLEVDNLAGFLATISGFAAGDQLILGGFASAGTTVSFTEATNNKSGTLTVSSGGKAVGNLTLIGGYINANFHKAGSPASVVSGVTHEAGTLVTYT